MKRLWAGFVIALSALLILSLSGFFAFGMYRTVQKLPVREYFAPEYTNAVWDWKSPIGRSEDEITRTAQWLYQHQFNTVYLDLSSVASGENTDKMDKALDTYISLMGQKEIRVFASGGDVSWSKPENRRYPVAILDYAHRYNERTSASKLAGFELDVESYNQDGFADADFDKKEIVLTELLDLVDVIATKQTEYIKQNSQHGLEIGFSVPYWFDNENKNIKSVTWLGKTGPTIYHIMDRLNSLPKSNVVVMAYRNASRGNDGVIVHSRSEVEYAQYKAANVKVIIGQEVTDVEPAKITYYGQTIAELSRETSLLKQEFESTKVFGGVAINDLAGIMMMADK